MVHVSRLTFNEFQENTYLVWDETQSCIIFDPGCNSYEEKQTLKRFIAQHELTPVKLINTHCHLDHVFGNQFVVDTYGIGLEIHKGELEVLRAVPHVCKMYGISLQDSIPEPDHFIESGDVIEFGNSSLITLFTPGHSPASLSFFNKENKLLIVGDVLFQGSIGRTDLPGGNYETLINSIKEKLLPLGDDVQVYPGHGPTTTIGKERISNPFLIE